MQLTIVGNESLLLTAVTSNSKECKLTKKVFHIYIEDDHLFIADNGWNSIAIKPYDYSWGREKDALSSLGAVKRKAIGSRAKKVDGICIDLTKNEQSKSMDRG